jgi:hypothetical protein
MGIAYRAATILDGPDQPCYGQTLSSDLATLNSARIEAAEYVKRRHKSFMGVRVGVWKVTHSPPPADGGWQRMLEFMEEVT